MLRGLCALACGLAYLPEAPAPHAISALGPVSCLPEPFTATQERYRHVLRPRATDPLVVLCRVLLSHAAEEIPIDLASIPLESSAH